MLGKKLIEAAAGSGSSRLYIEDVFQTWLYTGNGSTQTITNGIDLAGEGGLVWFKYREGVFGDGHYLYDTARGAGRALQSNHTYASTSVDNRLTSFTSGGFSLSTTGGGAINQGNYQYASWTFRKAPRFFDVVTYTGDGAGFFDQREIPHSLSVVPGCIIVKRTDSTGNWSVAFRKDSSTFYTAGVLNSTSTITNTYNNNFVASSTWFNPASIDSGAGSTNVDGATYVAYLFAHDAGGFGDDGTESVIKCGSYTGTGSNAFIDLGWEPQWLMVKRASSTSGNASQDSWHIMNSLSGITSTVNGNSPSVRANTADAEIVAGGWGSLASTGFYTGADNSFNGVTYIYIAIRRGPMKTPTDATTVFDLEAVNPSSGQSFSTGFPVDTTLASWRGGAYVGMAQDRLRGFPLSNTTGGHPLLQTSSAAADPIFASSSPFIYSADSNTSVKYGGNLNSTNPVTFAFRRAPGFFDVVAYTGTGSARTVSHNLGVAPELIIVKQRNSNRNFAVYHSSLGANLYLNLNNTILAQDGTFHWGVVPTSTEFTVGLSAETNVSSGTYIAYLFATCPGVSKVGSYTGTGTTLQVDCGFASGARFVLIKRTDSSGDWYVWDTARGIVSGLDPYLLLNSTAAEVTSTDYIDPYSAGFEISSTAPAAINASGGSFIYLAIA